MKKITIRCEEAEARLLARALDLYTRVGLLQFEYLSDCSSLEMLLSKSGTKDYFLERAKNLKIVATNLGKTNPGIFNKDLVQDDCRLTAHITHQIRHSLGDKGVFENPADICQRTNTRIPKFEVEVTAEDIRNSLVPGTKVHYCSSFNLVCYNGIVKEVLPDRDFARVVFNCDDDWENYQEYTSELTKINHLQLGWT